jgi:hypothetical protein
MTYPEHEDDRTMTYNDLLKILKTLPKEALNNEVIIESIDTLTQEIEYLPARRIKKTKVNNEKIIVIEIY